MLFIKSLFKINIHKSFLIAAVLEKEMIMMMRFEVNYNESLIHTYDDEIYIIIILVDCSMWFVVYGNEKRLKINNNYMKKSNNNNK